MGPVSGRCCSGLWVVIGFWVGITDSSVAESKKEVFWVAKMAKGPPQQATGMPAEPVATPPPQTVSSFWMVECCWCLVSGIFGTMLGDALLLK